MSGPAPKDPSVRRNRVPPARGEWVDIDKPRLDEDEIVLPELSAAQKKFLAPLAQYKWEIWRHDPVTTWWTEADIDFARETLAFYDDENGHIKHAAEIRQRADRLALTPKGKRDQRFRITFGMGKEATKQKNLPEQNSDVVSLDERRRAFR